MKRQSEAMIPMLDGDFKMVAYADDNEEKMPHLALISGDINKEETVLVRIHSECITGDLFGSKRCDCGEQLETSLQLIAQKGGIVIYLRQEGRGIGIINKLKAYNLQDRGLNTIDANTHLGLEVDARQYGMAITILQDLGVQSIDLLTNNPEKIEAIEQSTIKIRKRIPLVIPAKQENYGYLKTKKEEMGHLLTLERQSQ